MSTNQILGMAFTVLATNFHSQTIKAVKCPVKDCPVTQHYEVVTVFHEQEEQHVKIIGVDGDPVEKILEPSKPLRAIMVTNHFADLNVIQRRGRVAPMPVMPKVINASTNEPVKNP